MVLVERPQRNEESGDAPRGRELSGDAPSGQPLSGNTARRTRWPLVAALVVAVIASGALITALVLSGRSDGVTSSGGSPTTDGAVDRSTTTDATTDGTTDGTIGEAAEQLPPLGTLLVDAVCAGDVSITDMGPITSEQIDEASGLTASHTNPGIWWTHNDSGGRPEIYALDDSGRLVATVRLTGAEAVDWEDIASAVDDSGHETIYVGDIGDNGARRDHVTIYTIAAPVLPPQVLTPGEGTHGDTTRSGARGTDGSGAPMPLVLDADATATDLVYPDGPRDAEALIADHRDGALYIVDKDWSMKGDSKLYRVSMSDLTSPDGTATGTAPDGSTPDGTASDSTAPTAPVALERVADLDLPVVVLVTAADASDDGSAVALRGYGFEALYHRAPGESVVDALSGDHCRGPGLDEGQGEAIAFSADGSSYVTVAEGRGSVLHRVAPLPGR